MPDTASREYEASHPWLTFNLDFRQAPSRLWTLLGECRSKCHHLRNTPLRPDTWQQLHLVYLAKGVQGSAAIEGNSLSQEQVEDAIEGTLEVPPSREYLKREIENILSICNGIASKVMTEGGAKISMEWVYDTHRRQFEGLETEDYNLLGQFATVDIGVGRYRGAPRQDCEYLVQRLVDWVETQWSTRPDGTRWTDSMCAAIIKAVVAHLYFVWIHPFGDGNGRVSRLIEVLILLRAGVPMPAAQLLSNHYNLTRDRYYRELKNSSKSSDGLVSFLLYAVEGFRDGLKEQIEFVTNQQHRIFWRDYVYCVFRDKTGVASDRRRNLALEISAQDTPLVRQELLLRSALLATAYANSTDKTLSRDLKELEELKLITVSESGEVAANRDLLLPFLPMSVPEDS